ncbi:finger and BTB domain-containing 14-like [Octopus vulgaris]|uniref:Finger and BTB domain-containing 14-like n=1 Tax=Octopus vulgaris TaxID=6645 RepID=A0AA36BS66_OCTVU|nr:finger and BTB domain-containing 14-like [Octopus vulgaris]
MCTCSLCSKTFTSKSSLTTHMRSHYGVKPYQCDICKKRFTRNTSLNYHKLVHEEKFRFTCKLCDKHFRHRGHFNDHVLKHFIDEPFECGRCHKTFPSRQKSRDHVKVCNATDATPSKTMEQKVHEAHWQYFLHIGKSPHTTTQNTLPPSASNKLLHYVAERLAANGNNLVSRGKMHVKQ